MNLPQKLFLSVNEKHCSNKKESLKFLKDIILPYIQNVRQILESKSFLKMPSKKNRFLDALKCNKSTTQYDPPLSAIRFDGKQVCKRLHQTKGQWIVFRTNQHWAWKWPRVIRYWNRLSIKYSKTMTCKLIDISLQSHVKSWGHGTHFKWLEKIRYFWRYSFGFAIHLDAIRYSFAASRPFGWFMPTYGSSGTYGSTRFNLALSVRAWLLPRQWWKS